ncbi:hypothetical protein FHS31_002656 [Sphingomonas vulcanisoli]|uniref:Uncharacterized protein n=1 Tax=Sphingomonas vulcanisoli TaxID=1658060 RepID=A0ABX0TZG9_9SPHN|nr:hypothetical protein [Sphingomonas vulcanisoli]NIJ09026.1 hypothetical protein [Sphingomonas vulcanisoli]
MRFPKDQLVRMGTTVLAETADACLSARPHRGQGLRLALAMLYGLSDGPREPYVTFWKVCGILDVKGERARAMRQARYQAAWAAYAEILAGLTDQNWPGGPEDATTLGRRRHAAARGPERPQRSGNDTRMVAPTKSCGWL